jgi:hypothetical protein
VVETVLVDKDATEGRRRAEPGRGRVSSGDSLKARKGSRCPGHVFVFLFWFCYDFKVRYGYYVGKPQYMVKAWRRLARNEPAPGEKPLMTRASYRYRCRITAMVVHS